jgi:TATA-binding related factor (TRF) of subunit 20 of Mediator complex
MEGNAYSFGDYVIRIGTCRKGNTYKGLVLEVCIHSYTACIQVILICTQYCVQQLCAFTANDWHLITPLITRITIAVRFLNLHVAVWRCPVAHR